MHKMSYLLLITGLLMGATYKNIKNSADDALRRGNVQLAIVQYEDFLKQKDINKQDRFDAYLELADIYFYKLEKPKKALLYLTKAQHLFPDTYRRMDEVLYRMGLCYEKLGDYQKAAEMYEKVVMNFQKSKYSKEAWDRINIAFAHNYQDTVAYVGGEYITSLELENLIENLNPMAKRYYSTEEGKKKLLDEMIKRKLLVKEAEQRKLYLRSDVQNKLEQCKENVLWGAMINDLRNSITVSDKDVEKFYRSHLNQFKNPASIKAFRIVVKNKRLADSLYKLIKRKKANFDSLRYKFSKASDSKNKSPMVITKKGPKDNIFEKIFKIKKGKISKPIQMNDSTYVIYRVVDKNKEGYKPLKEVSSLIKARVQQNKEKEAYNNLIEQLKKKYKVKVFTDKHEGKTQNRKDEKK